MMQKIHPSIWLSLIVVLLYVGGTLMSQVNVSGTTVVANQGTAGAAAWKVDGTGGSFPVSGSLTANQGSAGASAWKVDGTGGTFPISGNIGNTSFGLNAGTAIIGIFRQLALSCTLTTPANFSTVGVATGAGTTVTSTTSCIAEDPYVNNTTNSAVTLRLADKQGTPVIWVGGNADFTIPANSNMRIPLKGITFTSGITAIAGTASALNLFIPTMQ